MRRSLTRCIPHPDEPRCAQRFRVQSTVARDDARSSPETSPFGKVKGNWSHCVPVSPRRMRVSKIGGAGSCSCHVGAAGSSSSRTGSMSVHSASSTSRIVSRVAQSTMLNRRGMKWDDISYWKLRRMECCSIGAA